MSKMRNQVGFTLIELVIVIVILGILSVTAAPRFLNLTSDARLAALKGLQGAMADAARLTHAKSVVSGVDQQQEGSISINNGTNIATMHGYPSNNFYGSGGVSGIIDVVEGLGDPTLQTGDVWLSGSGDWHYTSIPLGGGGTINNGNGVVTIRTIFRVSFPDVTLLRSENHSGTQCALDYILETKDIHTSGAIRREAKATFKLYSDEC